MKFSDKPAEVAVPSESKSNSEDKSRREAVGSSVNSSSNNLHVTRSALSESSESTEEMVDDGDDDFVEALESLDLTQPDNLRIYTGEVFNSRERHGLTMAHVHFLHFFPWDILLPFFLFDLSTTKTTLSVSKPISKSVSKPISKQVSKTQFKNLFQKQFQN